MTKGFSDIKDFPTDFKQKELAMIFDCVERSQSVQLVAPTGAGKSLILNAITESEKIRGLYLKTDLKYYTFAFIDLKFCIEKDLNLILSFIISKLPHNDISSASKLEEIVDKMLSKNQHLVLIFDSFNEVPNPDNLFIILKALYDQNRGRISYIFATNHEVVVNEKMKHFGAILTENILFIAPLTKKDFDWFIHEQENYLNIRLSKSEKDGLFKITGGFMATAKRVIETLKDKIKLLEITKSPENIDRISYHFQILLKDFSKEEKTLKNLLKKEASMEDLINISYLQKSYIIGKNNNFTIPLFKTYLINTLTNDNVAHKEIINDKIVINSALTAQEYKIVKYLTDKLNIFSTRDEIIEGVWGVKSQNGISDHALDQLVYRLRKKLKKNDPQLEIVTVWGRGHKATLQA